MLQVLSSYKCNALTNKCSEYAAKCSQVVSTGPEAGQMQGEEDCLNLNIFLPKERQELLPVMVWIHGGAFVEGSGQDGTPDSFIDRGVMVVMINYRCNNLKVKMIEDVLPDLVPWGS